MLLSLLLLMLLSAYLHITKLTVEAQPSLRGWLAFLWRHACADSHVPSACANEAWPISDLACAQTWHTHRQTTDQIGCGRDRKAAREKEVEREHDVAKERLRQVLAENEAPSDTEEDLWRRPLYTGRC